MLYPILDLTQHTQDLHWYLRSLEEVIIRALADTSGLEGLRIPGLTGVWVKRHKVAAIGIRARKWVTYHGLALNVSVVLEPFQLITPCGITDKPVGSVNSALERVAMQQQQLQQLPQQQQQMQQHDGATLPQGAAGFTSPGTHLQQHSSPRTPTSDQVVQLELQPPQPQQDLYAVAQDPMIVEYRYALLEAFEDVFGLQMVPASKEQQQQLVSASTPAAAVG